MRRLAQAVALAALVVCRAPAWQAVPAAMPGEPLPAWTPVTLDIHQISTGRGNAAFDRFPGGGTMLVDG